MLHLIQKSSNPLKEIIKSLMFLDLYFRLIILTYLNLRFIKNITFYLLISYIYIIKTNLIV